MALYLTIYIKRRRERESEIEKKGGREIEKEGEKEIEKEGEREIERSS